MKGGKEYNELNNDGFKLPCEATGENLQWRWQHNGTNLVIFSGGRFKVEGDGSLIGESLLPDQSGNYQCFVKDAVTDKETFSRKVQVLVTYIRPFLSTAARTETVDLGQSLRIPCPAHGASYGAVYTWSGAENIEFPRNSRRAISPDGELFIMFVTDEDITKTEQLKGISCTITGANAIYRSGPITLKKRQQDMIDPGTPQSPAWRVTPGSAETAVEGRNKTLYCFAVGRPPPTITWKKNGQTIVTGDDFEIAGTFLGRRLDLINVKKDIHEDTYTCEAENSQNSGNPNVFTTIVTVKVPPKWKDSKPPPEKQEIDIQGNGTLLCDAVGDPAPAFTWFKDGARIVSSTARVQVTSNKLTFKNVELEEDGVYQCVAENNLDMIVSSTWVNVLAKAPSFKFGFGPFYLFKDSEGRLDCEPDAAPPPTFEWSKVTGNNQGDIKHGGRYKLFSNGTLMIANVTQNDEGQYSCKATNFLDTDSATAEASVLERTRIVVKPEDKLVKEGDAVDLMCRAEYDKELEIRYFWKRDDARIDYIQNVVEWDVSKNVLTISNIKVEDAGVYTCIAYTPEPKRSEDSASAIINIQGVPFPPTKLAITDTCQNRTTTLTWVTSASNDAPILHFLVEQESNHEPNVFKLIYNVTNPNATSVTLNLTGWATLRFRLRAVNRLGPSRPSEATGAGICKTSLGKPDKYPDNLRGVPKEAEKLDIAWTPMPRVDWNAPQLKYELNYRRVGGEPPDRWIVERFNSTVGILTVPDAGYYKLWEFRIRAVNSEGLGPWSPTEQSYSGQDKPDGKPGNPVIGVITARSVELSWNPLPVPSRGSVDGYRIYYWGVSKLTDQTARRRRRAIPSYAKSTNVTGGTTKEATVYGLTPYTGYTLAIKAFNSGGEGPSSDEVTFDTIEDVPGPPSDIEVYPFAEYILVTWKPPEEPNGVITGYQVGSAEYTGSQFQDINVDMTEVGAGERRHLLSGQKELSDYVIEMRAKTAPGWGESVRKTTSTVKMSAPAKPKKPTVTGTAVDAVNVIYNFDIGGGYTHEFRVMYRKKLPDEEFVNTSWVNHFDVQNTDIGNLDNELYQFKTVGRNPLGESPPSDVTEARPLPGVAAGQRATTPIHKSAWFIALLVLVALLLLVLIIFVLYTRHRGAKYPVGKRERKRAALIDHEPYDEEEGPFNNGAQENPPPYPSQGSLDKKSGESDRDSLDDYGEGPQFNEDGSFIEEYGDEKKTAPDEKDQSAFATFV